jgi:PAS domain S-box-containing protein
MNWMRRRSIRAKLTVIVMATCAAALLLAGIALSLYDRYDYRRQMRRDLETLARITSSNSAAALAFNDARAAREILGALAAEKQIVHACLYTHDGEVLAVYSRAGSPGDFNPLAVENDNSRFTANRLVASERVLVQGESVGSVYLESDLEEARAHALGNIAALGAVLMISIFAAYLLGLRLQQSISAPVLELARTALAVTINNDYAIRAKKTTQDEIGFLYDQFNEMLGRIQQRDVDLNRSRAELEGRVGERTADLLRTVEEVLAAEEAVRKGKERLQAVLESVDDVIVELDAEGVFINVWNRHGELLMRPKEEVAGRSFGELFPGILAQQMKEASARVLDTGRTENLEYEVEVPAGLRWFSARMSRIPGEAGERPTICAVIRDITESRAAEDELKRAKDAAEAASEAKSEFLANMSHEIRTPMNGILGMTELTLDTQLTREQREYLVTVKNSADALLVVINDILDFSKIEAGKLEFDPVDFNLRLCLGETMETLALRAQQRGLEFACRIQPDVEEWVTGDPGRLRQVLVNLIGNAIKFTERGEVVLEVDKENQDKKSVTLHFTVHDTGIGIPEEKLGLIFDAFTQADSSMSRRYGGTGLGLAITRRLVEMMDGRIWANSEAGQGSTFHFTAQFGKAVAPRISVSQFEPEVVGEARALAKQEGRPGMRILLAEDNAVNRLVATRLLEKGGYEVVVAENGREAVDLAGRWDVQLVLMDVQMPEMDGFEATRALREKEKGTGLHLPIVAMTAHAMKGDREKCLAAGMDDYLTKPIRSAQLFKLLEHYANKGSVPMKIQNESEPELVVAETTQVWNLDKALARVCGDRDLLGELIVIFETECPKLISAIRGAIERDDSLTLELNAHGLKGAAANFSAGPAANRARDLEMIGRSQDLTGAAETFALLEIEIGKLLVEFETFPRKVAT